MPCANAARHPHQHSVIDRCNQIEGANEMAQKTHYVNGTVVQVMGPVVDVQFPPDELPEIYSALEVVPEGGEPLTLEVQQHLGNDWVRAVAMSSTDGLRRGMDVKNTGGPITVPVGPETLGRILN